MAKNGRTMDLGALQGIAEVTMTRGAHAFGFAWIDSKDRLRMFKQSGRIADHLGLLAMASDARMLIGHCRYATHGSPKNNLNNHPHPADGGWYVHNGVILGYESIIERYNMHPVTKCDSEVLGLLMERARGETQFDRARVAVNATPPAELAMMGLWGRPRKMAVIRRGKPLSIATTRDGHYMASLPEGLPGCPQDVEDWTAVEFAGGKVRHVELV